MVVMMSTPGCGATIVCSLPAIERPPGATSSVSRPRRALEQVVVLQLEAGDSDAIDVGAPDDALAGRAARHHPAVLGVGAHARHVERVDLAGDRRVDLAGDVAEADVLGGVAGDVGGQGGLVVGVEIEQLGEHRGGAGGIGDLQRVDGDRRRRHRQGELVAVAVEDRAALGRPAPGSVPTARRRRCAGRRRCCPAATPRAPARWPTRRGSPPAWRSTAGAGARRRSVGRAAAWSW